MNRDRRTRYARDLLLVILLSFTALLVVAFFVYGWFGGAGQATVYQLLIAINLSTATPWSVALHFGIGFAIGATAYLAIAYPEQANRQKKGREQRVTRLTEPRTRRGRAAGITLVVVLVVAAVLIAGKEFYFNVIYEGLGIGNGILDVLTYFSGIALGAVAGVLTE